MVAESPEGRARDVRWGPSSSCPAERRSGRWTCCGAGHSTRCSSAWRRAKCARSVRLPILLLTRPSAPTTGRALWGRRNPLFIVQALLSGTATKRIPCADFTRINTDFRPPGLRVGRCLAHIGWGGNCRAVHVENDVASLQAVARGAGSTCVTTTPSPPLRAGASDRPSLGTSVPGVSRSSLPARAARSPGNWPSVR
jgi:hypothetical protein